MGKIRGYLNLKPHKDASEQATNYVTDIGSNGIFVHPEGEGPDDTQTPTGWKIADAIELFRSGVSYIKAWIDNNVPKIRVGKEDGGHVEIQSSGMNVYGGNNGQTQFASFGASSVIGTSATGLTLSSSGISLKGNNIESFAVTRDTSDLREIQDVFTGRVNSGSIKIGTTINPYETAQIYYCEAYDETDQVLIGEVPSDEDFTEGSFSYSYDSATKEISVTQYASHMYAGKKIRFTFQMQVLYATAGTQIGIFPDDLEDGSVLKVGVGKSENERISAFKVRYNGETRVRGDIYVNCDDDSTGGTKVLSEAKIDTGEHSFSNLAANTATNISVTFSKEFATAPQVVAGLKSSLTSATTGNVAVSASNVTTTGFTLRAYNGSSVQKTIYVSWIAVGL